MTITIKKTVNETVEIKFPIYLRQSQYAVIALYNENNAIEVNSFDSTSNYSLYKNNGSVTNIEGLIQSCTVITMEEYNDELKKCIAGINKNISLACIYDDEANSTATPKEIQQLNDDRNQEMREDWQDLERQIEKTENTSL
jgi:hypothetical protein